MLRVTPGLGNSPLTKMSALGIFSFLSSALAAVPGGVSLRPQQKTPSFGRVFLYSRNIPPPA